MGELTNLKVGMRTLTFFYFNGVVENRHDSSHTTRTYEQGSNHLVSSHTEFRSDLVIRNAAGDVQQLNATAAKLSIREGARVTLVMAARSDNGPQQFLAIQDQQTGQTGYFAKGVNDMAGPPLYNMGIIVALVVGTVALLNLNFGNFVLLALSAGFFYELYRRRKIVRAHVVRVIEQNRDKA